MRFAVVPLTLAAGFGALPVEAQTIEEPARSALIAVALDCREAQSVQMSFDQSQDAADQADAACRRAIRAADYASPDAGVRTLLADLEQARSSAAVVTKERRAGRDWTGGGYAAIGSFAQQLEALDQILKN